MNVAIKKVSDLANFIKISEPWTVCLTYLVALNQDFKSLSLPGLNLIKAILVLYTQTNMASSVIVMNSLFQKKLYIITNYSDKSSQMCSIYV